MYEKNTFLQEFHESSPIHPFSPGKIKVAFWKNSWRLLVLKKDGCSVPYPHVIPYISNKYIPTKTLLHFVLLHFASKVVTFCVTDVITFCIESYYSLRYYYILWQKLLHFALLSHFVSVITFCGVTSTVKMQFSESGD